MEIAGEDVPVTVLPLAVIRLPAIVSVPEYVSVPVTVIAAAPQLIEGLAPKGHVVEAAIFKVVAELQVNLLNVLRASLIVAAAVILMVPELCVNVVELPLCVQLPASVHVLEVAVRDAELPNVTAVVDMADDEPVKIGLPVFSVNVVDVNAPPPKFTVPVVCEYAAQLNVDVLCSVIVHAPEIVALPLNVMLDAAL